MRLGDLDALKDRFSLTGPIGFSVRRVIDEAPTIDAVPVTEIKAYLQKCLDEWNALGDRKFEPANMWGYNFIMACFDDLERKDGEGNGSV